MMISPVHGWSKQPELSPWPGQEMWMKGQERQEEAEEQEEKKAKEEENDGEKDKKK